MSTLTKMTRTVKKLEVPRPLKSTTSSVLSRNSALDVKVNSVEELIVLTEAVACQITQGNYDRVLQLNVETMYQHLKLHGSQLENAYKDFLDRFFIVFRNGSQDEKLDKKSRLHLLELIELRAKHWQTSDCMSQYYRHRVTHAEPLLVPTMDPPITSGSVSPTLPSADPPPLLGPGEVIKASGKFNKPTKIPGKNYSKDEVVIRNADSGKVMGIKGRRVHMIEELSDTIISFQRVSPGAKERLVQITGPNEENVNHAKHLIGDTIRRNASPVRYEATGGELRASDGSLSSEDGSPRPFEKNQNVNNRILLHSFSTNDAQLGEYKYTVTFGQHSIKITGNNLDIVKTAKLVLDEYFESIVALDNGDASGDFISARLMSHRSDASNAGLLSVSDETGYTQTNGVVESHDDDVFVTQPQEENSSEVFVRRPRFSRSITSEKKEGGGNRRIYTYEAMLSYAASPLSRSTPTTVLPPEICRKSSLEFDGEAHLKAAGTSTAVIPTEEVPDSPEPE